MSTFNKQLRRFGLWALLLVLTGLSAAWAQVPFKISGKACASDQECKNDPMIFTDTLARVTNRKWDFGDNTTALTTKDSVVFHGFAQPGVYTVKLTRTINGKDSTVQRPVNVFAQPQPFPKWRTDTTICKGEKITLDPYNGQSPSGLTFLWYPKGDTTQTIRVDSSGCYFVQATDPTTGCFYQNRINVDVCGEQKQAQGVKWYFGGNAGLDFGGGGAPKPITDGTLNTIEGSSSIANTKGQLLFYTDGITIYDKNGKPLKSLVPGDTTANQIPLGGNKNSTQSALIVPKPTCRGCEYLYYVYTTSEIRGTKQLTYSVVDMRQNGGKGAIVQKNVPVAGQSTESSASVENKRDSTYWVLTRDFGSNCFRINHLTKGTEPEQKVCAGPTINSKNAGEGYMKIGPADTTSAKKGDRPLALVIPGPPRNSVALYTFNDSTGKLTYNRTIDLGPAPPKAYGVEFSPDSKSLYVTMVSDTNTADPQKGTSYILKYDLSQTDSSRLAQSRTVVDSSTTRQYGSIQIAPDGKIYVAIQGSKTLGVIANPNGGLLDSLQFNPQGQTLGGKTSQLGLPNLVANFNDPSSGPGLSYADTCANSPTTFQISPNCPKLKEAYTLTFGDGSRPVSTTSTQPITHTYTKAGRYAVSLRILTKTSTGGICKDTLIKDTLTILETPPNIKLGPDTSICNKRGITLDIKVQAKIYVWLVNGQVAGRQRTITFTKPGFYRAIGIAANGECFKSDTIEVQIKPPPPLDLGPDTAFCYRSSVQLTVPQLTWNKFQWSNGGTERSTTVTKAGTYTVTAQNYAGCENSDTINVRELPKLRLAASLTGPTTCTAADGIIALTPNPAGSYTYNWSRSDGAVLASDTSRQSNLTEGQYRVQATDRLYGCKADTSFGLKSPANRLSLTPTAKGALCSVPNSGSASVAVSGGVPVSYVWLNAANTAISSATVLTGVPPGLYGVEVRDAGGCKLLRDSIRVGLDSTGFANLGPARLKCAGDTVMLIPADGGLPNNTYQWTTGSTNRSVVVNQAGTYGVVVRNPNGCVGRSTVQVGDQPAPAFTLPQQVALCVGDRGQAQIAAGGAPTLRFQWLGRPDTTRSITVNQLGAYQVRVTNPQGCTAIGTARVVNLCEPRFNAPDAFSPNGDGINDQFQVFSSYITDYELRVYNRWGEVIFVTNSPEQKWDGTYRGEAYPSMLYPWVVAYKSEYFPERGTIVKRGSVLLVR